VRLRRPGPAGCRPASSDSAGFPASPYQPGCFPSRTDPTRPDPRLPVSRSPGFPRLTVSGSPGFPGSPFPDPLVSQAHRFRISRFPASPVRAVRLPVRPGATRRPPVPGTRGKYRFPGLSRAPGIPPGWCPFPAVKAFLCPRRPVAQELTAIHFEFFPRPHVVHRMPPVIRISRRLSTGFFTSRPQVTASLKPHLLISPALPSQPRPGTDSPDAPVHPTNCSDP
jgi:hypothetical protein